MKLFTDPDGLFIVRLPTEWQYSNVAEGYKEESPYSFIPYDDPASAGAFQISCYPVTEKTPMNNVQKANTYNLEFLSRRMDDDEFNIHLWYCTVEDHYFMIKYIYSKKYVNTPRIEEELRKTESTLLNISFVSEDRRSGNLAFFRLDKFESALAASFDLRNHAEKSGSMVEVIMLVATQIDAYLRLCILMKKQLDQNTNNIDERYIYQGENDKPISERAIYKESQKMGIISDALFESLNLLYGQRNRVVHRYIISEIHTRDLLGIMRGYQDVCEEVRVLTASIEDEQRSEKIGIYGYSAESAGSVSNEKLAYFYSGVNDKHLIKGINRKIDPS